MRRAAKTEMAKTKGNGAYGKNNHQAKEKNKNEKSDSR
jgi:hypothetical protein